MPAKTPSPPVRDDVEQLARDVARDTVAAARVGWRIASRVGHAGLSLAERATNDIVQEFEKRRPKKPGGSS